MTEELRDEPALAEPGFADDRREPEGASLHGGVEQVDQGRQLRDAPNERSGGPPCHVDAERRPRRLRVEDPDGLALALENGRGQLLVVEPVSVARQVPSPDRDAHFGRDRLDAGRRVDAVAGQEPLANARPDVQPHERLASVDADPEAERRPAQGRRSRASSVIRRAARTARSGSSPWATGTPKTPTTASPMNFSTTPPWSSICDRTIAKYRVSIRSTSSGSAPSLVAVKPTRSQNSAVMTLRSSVTAVAWSAARREPQPLQNFAPVGFSVAQAGQRSIA